VENLRHGGSADRLEVRLSGPDEAVEAAEMLGETREPASVRADGPTVVLTGEDLNTPDVVSALVHAGLRIEEVARPVKSLEDVYFEIVRDNGVQS
jgi:hypothetical protein